MNDPRVAWVVAVVCFVTAAYHWIKAGVEKERAEGAEAMRESGDRLLRDVRARWRDDAAELATLREANETLARRFDEVVAEARAWHRVACALGWSRRAMHPREQAATERVLLGASLAGAAVAVVARYRPPTVRQAPAPPADEGSGT